MVLQLKSLAANPDDLSLIPGTHKAEGENQLLYTCPLISTYMPVAWIHIHAHTHTHITRENIEENIDRWLRNLL